MSDLSAADIRNMLADQAESVVNAVMPGASWRKKGTAWRCGGPGGHAGSSFCVFVGSSARRGTFWDFTSGTGGSLIDLIMVVEGQDVTGAFRRAREILGLPSGPETPDSRARREKMQEKARQAAAERERRSRARAEAEQRKIQALWARVVPMVGTPGETYFREIRRISVPACCRYLPMIYWEEGENGDLLDMGSHPCIVTPFVANRGGKPVITALHLTYIDLDQPKGKLVLSHPDTGEILPAKKMRGSPQDGIIRLTRARPVMVAAEGIENTQSLLDVDPSLGGWCSGSSGRFEALVFPDLVQRVIGVGETDSSPARDADGTVRLKEDGTPLVPADESLRAAARLWAQAGKRVDLRWFEGDPNALLMRKGVAV
jgi:hypothetical protein